MYGALQVFLIRIAAQKNKAAAGELFPDELRKFHALHMRHFNISYHDGRLHFFRKLQRAYAVLRKVYGICAQFSLIYVICQSIPHQLFIIYNQNGYHSRFPLSFYEHIIHLFL